MATQLLPPDLSERSPKRHRGSEIGGFRGFGKDDELESLMAGEISLDVGSGNRGDLKKSGGSNMPHRNPSQMMDTTDPGGVQIEDLAVANERGEAVGSYVAPQHLSIAEAYRNFVTARERPVQDFDIEIKNVLIPMMREVGLDDTGAPAKTSSVRESGDDSESSTSSDGDRDPINKAMRRLAKKTGDEGFGRTRGRKRKHNEDASPQEIQRREIDLLCTYGSAADREYILNRFATEIRDANIDEETLFSRLCPLCGFMDNTQDAVGNQEFQMIDRFADEGVGNMDADTHATLLAFLWNKRIYLPMRRRNLRVLPLTARMARDHVTEPHRFNKRAELLNDLQDLRKTHRLLMSTAFRRNTMTGELGFDKDRLLVAVKVMDQKWKLIGTRDDKDPFRTAHRVTAASAGTQTNPLQSVRRRARNKH